MLSALAPAATSATPGVDSIGSPTLWLATVILGSTALYVSSHAALGAEEVRLAASALLGRWRRSSLRRTGRR